MWFIPWSFHPRKLHEKIIEIHPPWQWFFQERACDPTVAVVGIILKCYTPQRYSTLIPELRKWWDITLMITSHYLHGWSLKKGRPNLITQALKSRKVSSTVGRKQSQRDLKHEKDSSELLDQRSQPQGAEINPQLRASKETVTSLLQPQRTGFCKQPKWAC